MLHPPPCRLFQHGAFVGPLLLGNWANLAGALKCRHDNRAVSAAYSCGRTQRATRIRPRPFDSATRRGHTYYGPLIVDVCLCPQGSAVERSRVAASRQTSGDFGSREPNNMLRYSLVLALGLACTSSASASSWA